MTGAEKTRVREGVVEQWRVVLAAEGHTCVSPYDPVALGVFVAKGLEYHADEIEREVAEAIEASEMRQAWRGRAEPAQTTAPDDACCACGVPSSDRSVAGDAARCPGCPDRSEPLPAEDPRSADCA